MWFGTLDDFSCRERRKSRYTQVHTNRALVFGFWEVRRVRRIHIDADEPAIRHPGDRGRLDMTNKTQRLAQPHPAKPGDADAPVVNLELVVSERKPIMYALFTKFRVSGTAGKVIRKRLAQLNDRHLWRVLGNLHHPGKLFTLDRIELATQGQLVRFG